MYCPFLTCGLFPVSAGMLQVSAGLLEDSTALLLVSANLLHVSLDLKSCSHLGYMPAETRSRPADIWRSAKPWQRPSETWRRLEEALQTWSKPEPGAGIKYLKTTKKYIFTPNFERKSLFQYVWEMDGQLLVYGHLFFRLN